MVKYHLIERVNPQDILGIRKHYAVVHNQGEINLRQLATRISRESTISMMDTMAVLEGLLQVIPDTLIDGRIVKLGELGTFRLSISSDGVDDPDEFNSSMIKALNLRFRPGLLFREQLNKAKFTKQSDG